MTFLEFQNALRGFVVFSLRDIHNLKRTFYRARLNEWQDKGYIKKVLRGYYIFADQNLDEYTLFVMANKIYSPSYISFESALSYYHLIPESVYSITSATSMLPRGFNTPLAAFKYHMIKTPIFFGYELINKNNRIFKIACPEKAILDYFYINTKLAGKDDFEKLRFNPYEFAKHVSLSKMDALLAKIGQKSLSTRVNIFVRYIKNA